jgi:nucleotide-binding universal stress UspA family protein
MLLDGGEYITVGQKSQHRVQTNQIRSIISAEYANDDVDADLGRPTPVLSPSVFYEACVAERRRAISSAAHDFQRARQRAALYDLIARLTGRSDDLLAFEDVRRKLRAMVSPRRQLRDIPLAAIVGSVGRAADFTRDFLPRNESDAPRWSRVKAAVISLEGVPPIEVYQIGETYFVLDGNHRVSVARQLGSDYIQAYVTEVQTRVPLEPDVSLDDLIVKSEYVDFLERTRLDEQRPGCDLAMSVPGQYAALEAQIEAQQAKLAPLHGDQLTFEAAAAHWYDSVYLPVVHAIRDQGILHDFPGRAEADLYVWLAQYRAELEQSLGWDVAPGEAASDLASQRSQRPMRVVARLGERLLDAVTPEALESGPTPGAGRQARRPTPSSAGLVADLLVALDGEEAGWRALDHALFVAQQEGSRLAGLHVVPAGPQIAGAAQAVRDEFERRCAAAGVPGRLAIEAGSAARQICGRARWTDLVVVSLSYAPGDEPITRLRNGFRTLVQRCPRPILAVPNTTNTVAQPQRILLPYDSSPKAEEALFFATYLALHWKQALAVLTVVEDERTTAAAQERARSYLESHAVDATYLIERGAVGEAILRTAEAQSSDVIVIGGYGMSPLLEIVLGSAVDQVLRASRRPVLICQ